MKTRKFNPKVISLTILFIFISSYCLAFLSFPSKLYADDNKFTIGLSLPLSGDMAQFGTAVMNAFELAKAENQEAFQNIKLIYEDNQYSPTLAVTNYQKFVSLDFADLIYVWGDHPASVLARTAENDKQPLLAISSNQEYLKETKYVVRGINSYEEYSEVLLDYLRSKGYKKIGIVRTEDPYYGNLLAGMQHRLRSDESIDIVANYQYDDNDFRTIIAKIKQSNFQAIGVFLMPGQVSAFFNQAAAQRLGLPAFGADVFESSSEVKAANGHMEGSVYVHNYISDDFRGRYLRKHGNDYQLAYAAMAYETARWIGRMFGKKQKKFNKQEILESLSKELSIESEVTGHFDVLKSIEGATSLKFPVVIKKITGDGAFSVVPIEY